MTPLASYRQQLATGKFTVDAQQEIAMQHLQRVYTELLAEHSLNAWQQAMNKVGLGKKKPVRGVYLWGTVGAGKTWLMDTFYQALPIKKKQRLHFHRFMQFVQHELQRLQGQANPLKIVAKNIAAKADILCFDEFLVTDIVDAMLLANLLKALFAERITLVTTANVEPDLLYRNGLQRARFLPAITLLKQHTNIVQLSNNIDYRLRTHEQIGAYFYPLNSANAQHMQQLFSQLGENAIQSEKFLLIEGRPIPILGVAKNIIWFDFHHLCHTPRSQLDYLAISEQFSTVLLSNVPKISVQQDNTIRYLINLVDIFYDAKVKLIISAATPVAEIYTEGRLHFEFRRTCSRLLEMQSQEYLSLAKK